MKQLSELEKELDIQFKDKELLRNAFIHRSYLNEHTDEKLPNNERLEFLGDSVLSSVVSEYIYHKYPTHPEGDLTNFRASIVNAKILSRIAQELELGQYLFLSRGEEATGGRTRQYLLANTFEALLGAIYLDLGMESASAFVHRHLLPQLEDIVNNELYKDFKSKFQELAQEQRGVTPSYRVLKEEGPDHEKHFTTGVYVGEELIAKGDGRSKQQAEQEAAKAGLAKYQGLR